MRFILHSIRPTSNVQVQSLHAWLEIKTFWDSTIRDSTIKSKPLSVLIQLHCIVRGLYLGISPPEIANCTKGPTPEMAEIVTKQLLVYYLRQERCRHTKWSMLHCAILDRLTVLENERTNLGYQQDLGRVGYSLRGTSQMVAKIAAGVMKLWCRIR